MRLVGNIPQDFQGAEVDPQIHQQYVDMFSARPRSLKEQGRIDRIAENSASEAAAANHDRLTSVRQLLTSRIYTLSTGMVQPETATIMHEQAREHYQKTLLGIMWQGGLKAQARLRTNGVVSDGEAVRLGSAHVLRQESIERIRELNNGFSDAFKEVGTRMPRIQKVTRYLGFVVTYPDRPSHFLLKENVATDIPTAEVAYGQQNMDRYFAEFDASVGTNWKYNATPDMKFFVDEALDSVLNNALFSEELATSEALGGVL